MSSRVRILPVCIFLAFMMLCVKSYEIGSGLNLVPGSVQVATLHAAETNKAVPTSSALPQAQATQIQGSSSKTLIAQAGTTEETVTEASIGARDEVVKEPLPDSKALLIEGTDPSALERSLLNEIREKREEYTQKVASLRTRERQVLAAEKRVQEKIGQLEALRQTIEDLIGKHENQEEERMRALVKIYENMKPKDAAAIFEELDNLVLLDVVERMKERKVAPILGNMQPTRAKEITVELAKRRNLPLSKGSLPNPQE